MAVCANYKIFLFLHAAEKFSAAPEAEQFFGVELYNRVQAQKFIHWTAVVLVIVKALEVRKYRAETAAADFVDFTNFVGGPLSERHFNQNEICAHDGQAVETFPFADAFRKGNFGSKHESDVGGIKFCHKSAPGIVAVHQKCFRIGHTGIKMRSHDLNLCALCHCLGENFPGHFYTAASVVDARKDVGMEINNTHELILAQGVGQN